MTAKVVFRGFDSDCARGFCPDWCSHHMWKCDDCTCEGGWGAQVEALERYAPDHVCLKLASGHPELRTPCCVAPLNWDEQYDEDGNVNEIHLRCIDCGNEWDGAGDPINKEIRILEGESK